MDDEGGCVRAIAAPIVVEVLEVVSASHGVMGRQNLSAPWGAHMLAQVCSECGDLWREGSPGWGQGCYRARRSADRVSEDDPVVTVQ